MTIIRRRNAKTDSRPHGKKIQEDALILIEEAYLKFPNLSFTNIIKHIKQQNPLPIPIITLRRWWKQHEIAGLYPYELKQMNKKIKKIGKKYKKTSIITNDIVQCLKAIVDEHPEYYLDEIYL